MAKKDPPNNRVLAGITTGVSAALAWNANRKRKKDASLLQVANKNLNPKKPDMTFKNALQAVDTLGESKSGRRKLRGLRRTGQLVDVKDARKEDRANRKKKRMQKRYGEMKLGGAAREMDPNYALDYMKKKKKSKNGGGNDIPGTLAVGNVAEDLMGPPKRKKLVSNVLKKAAKLSQQKKKKK